jgi:general secretion pathway protein G
MEFLIKIGEGMQKIQLIKIIIKGFTLIELIIVMSIISLLLTLAAPRYFKSIERSKETVLKANLTSTRDALDKFYSDTGQYPNQLQDLVDKKYLRTLPWDPIEESSKEWLFTPPASNQKGTIYNIHSKAAGNGSNGIPYAQW